MKLVLKIAAGILLAAFILFMIKLLFLGVFLTGIKEITGDAAARQKQAKVEREQKISEDERLKLERDSKAEEKVRIEAEYKRLKASAWRKYYQEPEDCLVFQSDAHMVECVDNKKRARKEFDRLYDQGEIR